MKELAQLLTDARDAAELAVDRLEIEAQGQWCGGGNFGAVLDIQAEVLRALALIRKASSGHSAWLRGE